MFISTADFWSDKFCFDNERHQLEVGVQHTTRPSVAFSHSIHSYDLASNFFVWASYRNESALKKLFHCSFTDHQNRCVKNMIWLTSSAEGMLSPMIANFILKKLIWSHSHTHTCSFIKQFQSFQSVNRVETNKQNRNSGGELYPR